MIYRFTLLPHRGYFLRKYIINNKHNYEKTYNSVIYRNISCF